MAGKGIREMELIKAKPEQADDIAAIWHEGWHVGHAAVVPGELVARRKPAEFAARARAHLGQTWVAMQGGRMVGFVMIEDRELYQFYVNGALRGQGIAAQLMAGFEALMPPGKVWLACSVGNDRAGRFYEKCGWVRAATEPYELETGEGPLSVEIWRYEKTL